MKRYRVLHSDYDYRANLLRVVVTDQWIERPKRCMKATSEESSRAFAVNTA